MTHLTAAQMSALKRLAKLGINPYGWEASDVGSSRRTLAALEERGFIYGGHIYGCRVRSYIIQDPGRDYLASADILPKGQDEGLAGTESGAVVSESEPDARKPVP